MTERQQLAALLDWYVAMGIDEAIGETAHDSFAPPPPRTASVTALAQPGATTARPTPSIAPPPTVAPMVARPIVSASHEIAGARRLADAATTLAELEAAISSFEGCALRKTATHTVFADGTPHAPVMVIGEAPGADEDRLGKPFVGRSGQLLDRMLAAIGLDRQTNAYITNILFWRPPGNRKPTEAEIALCLPFVWRHIALGKPRVVLLSGGTATSAILGRAEGITKLRGKWFDLPVPGLDSPVPALTTYHPSFLLRTPGRKNESWRDFLELQSKLNATQKI
ncbi:MAG TPA: uracil-DNA glycosylase [Stellaceae bacterium]|jgi:DNA polymerase|nr:uracil-DNA glycosylase [Stellaceae bacterium]